MQKLWTAVGMAMIFASGFSAQPAHAAQAPAVDDDRRQRQIDDLEFQISGLKENMAYARGVIRQQRAAAAVSGFVDRNVMYRAGLMVSHDQEMIAQYYARYRSLGGRKALAQIHR